MYNRIQYTSLPNTYNNHSRSINSINENKTSSLISDASKNKDIVSNVDTITISETNITIINSNKAQNALAETVSKFSGKLYPCGSGQQDITGVLADLTMIAQGQGIETPLNPNFNIGTSYKSYIDNLSNFAEKLSKSRPDLVPPDFLDFCKQYKDNLIKYDCK